MKLTNDDAIRARFEHWYSNEGKQAKLIERLTGGAYKFMSAATAWRTWRAAAEAERDEFAATAMAMADALTPCRWVHPGDLELPCAAAFSHPVADEAQRHYVPLYDQASLDAALNLWPRDCRLCALFTTEADGCTSLVQCVDSLQFKATAPRQYWIRGPNVRSNLDPTAKEET